MTLHSKVSGFMTVKLTGTQIGRKFGGEVAKIIRGISKQFSHACSAIGMKLKLRPWQHVSLVHIYVS